MSDWASNYLAAQPAAPQSDWTTQVLSGAAPPPASTDAVPSASPSPAQPSQWSDLPGNIIPSAKKNIRDLAQPFLHPVQTAQGLYNLATDPSARSAVADFYKDRYGGIENLHDTLIKDPVGVAADLAGVLTGGEWALGKVAANGGKLASVANAMGSVGRAVDPVTNAFKAVGAVASVPGKVAAGALGKTTLAGTDAVKDAAQAGYDGSRTFLDNLRGKVPPEAVIDDVQNGVNQMKQQQQAAYQANFPDVGKPIDTTPIHDAYDTIIKDNDAVTDLVTPNGMPKASPEVWNQIQSVKDLVDKYTTQTTNRWVQDAPGVGGWRDVTEPAPRDVFELDGLKQALNDMSSNTTNPKVNRVISQVRSAITDTIDTAHPGYSDVMDKYNDAAQVLGDIRQTLSTGTKAGVDTKLMKLGRIYNDTPTGVRSGQMIDTIQDASGQPIRAALAGQRMQNWLPGGGKLLPMMGEAIAGGEAAKAFGLAKTAAVLPLASPRLVGEAAYKLGRAGSYLSPLVPSAAAGRYALQMGRQMPGISQLDESQNSFQQPSTLAQLRAQRAAAGLP